MRLIIALLLSLASLFAADPKLAATANQKTVQVRQYRRKDGTLVKAYTRRAPGTAGTARPNATKGVPTTATPARSGPGRATPTTKSARK